MPDQFGMTVDDLAMDVIADLFGRDEHGRFSQLANYFESIAWHEQSEEYLHAATRRLVMSQVTEGLFYRHQEHDPGLGRIIRNLKRSLDGHPELVLTKRLSRPWIMVLGELNTDSGARPLMPPEFLEAYLASAGPARDTPDLLRRLAEILRHQSVYRKSVPLTLVAQAVRAANVHLEPDASVSHQMPRAYQKEDVIALVSRCVELTHQSLKSTYVDTNKVDRNVYLLYVRAVHNRILYEVGAGSHDNPCETNFEALCAVMAPLSRDAYTRDHRAIFEYMMRVTKGHLSRRLTAEEWISARASAGKDTVYRGLSSSS
jgi:hypothetical protein